MRLQKLWILMCFSCVTQSLSVVTANELLLDVKLLETQVKILSSSLDSIQKQKKRRLFVAITIPQDTLHDVVEIQQDIKGKNLINGRYLDPKTMHATLLFLGDVPENDVQKVSDSLASIHGKPFEVCLDTLGINDRANVVWLKLKSQELSDLAKMIKNSLRGVAEFDSRDFIGHITLARVTTIPDKQKLLDYFKNYIYAYTNQCFSLDHFLLMESKGNYDYVIIKEFKLNHL